ncbi:hypothetical protein [Novosphingobium sp.]|nr:hypothetical protein [Novosphingobium sp.]
MNPQIGSILVSRVCHTAEEWAKIDRAQQERVVQPVDSQSARRPVE